MHPVEADPDLRARIRAAGQADRVEREIVELESRVQRHNQSLAREFDGVLGVLSAYGYVDREAWALTEAGAMLARTFHESDSVGHAVFATRAARRSHPRRVGRAGVDVRLRAPRAGRPTPTVVPLRWHQAPWRSIAAVSEDLAAIERSYGLAEHRPPDPTFIAVAYAWIAGDSFAEVVADEELTVATSSGR
jgi:ATP-dependent RNA helicase HelY